VITDPTLPIPGLRSTSAIEPGVPDGTAVHLLIKVRAKSRAPKPVAMAVRVVVRPRVGAVTVDLCPGGALAPGCHYGPGSLWPRPLR